jgi:glycine dehydrogenase
VINPFRFEDRHIGPSDSALATMLMELGFADLNQFTNTVLPESIKIIDDFSEHLPKAISEYEVLAELRELAQQNGQYRSLIGNGYYGTHTPHVILRNVLENPSWYTAYTPYQPEISQGRLEALFAFQTMITDLTGLDIANASMLDEPTAVAEAMTLALRKWDKDLSPCFLIEENSNPQTIAVVETRAKPLGIEVKKFSFESLLNNLEDEFRDNVFAIYIQSPNTHGVILNLEKVSSYAHSKQALVIAGSDLLALSLMKTPGEYGCDIAVGSAQRFGVPMGFGGPHAGFMAIKKGLERSLPGRLVGQSIDSHGNPALRLALQTREQHIRRDKATSNICTAQVLLANIAAFYGIYHGPDGLKTIAHRVHNIASYFAEHLKTKGIELRSESFFDTISFIVPSADIYMKRAAERSINLRETADGFNISFDETVDQSLLQSLAEIFEIPPPDFSTARNLKFIGRKNQFLSHSIFNSYHSETAMMRYLRSLSDKDLALDRTMIPLGSCTMKLNAVMEMESVTWPEFANLHPFAPSEQSRGTRKLISQLSQWLIDITGYDSISLQPNAGSQGEFAGLLAIKNYLASIGQSDRDICLIPSSAHGTNAASAVMAGMQVVVIECDEKGNVSLKDLERAIEEYGSKIAALMVTYPSTHGVFESGISRICEMIHEAGGQVYVDGANLNALVGLAKPGKFGADVSHLNLHKTFCIPHGGGGPGVGPVAAKAHLAPFLPNHPLDKTAGPESGPGPISGAPFGSAGILPISWAYIRAMGGDGLKQATGVAILSANYIAKKLEGHFPILYRGETGFIAHECIIDIRDLTKSTGVSVDDIAKRLMDYGFHAPTMSFPVAGTLMIEPTESEDIAEIDRFIAAMISIREEIRDIEKERFPIEKSPLRNAPHTSAALLEEDWNFLYTRKEAAFPAGIEVGLQRREKFWPSVGRIDGVYGDRNLVCSCEPIEALAINR